MKPFNDFLQQDLNEPQRNAVTQADGTLLVIAGAGSGKTRVITARMAHLINNLCVDPLSIIALTFTNKAANEMKHRLAQFLPTATVLPFVGTFHSYCLLLLRRNRQLLPFPDFSIMDDDDQQDLLKKIIKRQSLEKQVSASQLSYAISRLKNKIHNDEPENFQNPIIKELILAYETEKSQAHCFDFDDLLITVHQLFQTNPQFKKQFQYRIKHILVDEYQDTNGVQHELLKQMALDEEKKCTLESLCVVGDEDQSIYSWRGAMVTNMLSIQKDFAPVTLIKIEQNYRSVQPILQAANHVIENNTNRHPKELWSERKAKNRILSVQCQSGYQEADTMALIIKMLPAKTSRNEIAILYRTHFQSRVIEEVLIRNSIPYHIVGGIRFYERREIKDLLAYLRLVANPFDRTSFFRVINTPTRGLGEKFEELIYTEWNKNPFFDFKQLLTHLLNHEQAKLTAAKAHGIEKFLALFTTLSKDDKPSAVVEHIMEQTEYMLYLRENFDQHESEIKTDNVREFVRSIEIFEKTAQDSKTHDAEPIQATLENFLHDVALLQEKLQQTDESSDHVQMMTLHAAKGLEFDTVIIAGLEEGLLPSMKSLNSYEAFEEERRLFYVGMTRAKERLIITRAQNRNTYGQITDQVASRFVAELPSSLVHPLDMTQLHTHQSKQFIGEWLGVQPQASGIMTFYTPHSKRQKPTAAPSKTNHIPEKNFRPFEQKKESFVYLANAVWKKSQPVAHKKFGVGIITDVEKVQDSENFYLTVSFREGVKKILSTFVQKV